MAAAHLRRSVATAAVAAVTTVIAPLAVSLLAPTTALAATAPAIDPSKSSPMPNGSLVKSEDILAVWDQAISAVTGSSSSGACADPTKCSFVLYEVNADGSRGLRIPGTVSLASSSSLPGGTQDTLDFAPSLGLRDGNTYEAVAHVLGFKSDGKTPDPSAVGSADYRVYVSSAAPTQLTNGGTANNADLSAYPLSGVAAPGLVVNVDVANPDDPTHQLGFSDATASTTVDACSSAPLCPWTAKVDLSHFQQSSYSSITWTAQTQDAQNSNNKGAGPAAGPPFALDTSAPNDPSASHAAMTTDQLAVTVSATDDSSDINRYQITITDSGSGKVQQVYPSSGTNLSPTNVDVSSLGDGTLTVVIQAMDTAGNVSHSSCQNPVQGCPIVQTVTKKAGLAPDFTTSLITAGGSDTTFANAEQQSVQSPTKVTVGFSQTIKESWSDCCTTSGPTTHHSAMCVASTNGNCIATGTLAVVSDSRSISMSLASKLPDGKYEIYVHTYSATNCPDRTPQNAATYSGCPDAPLGQYNDFVRIPGTAAPGTPFTFTVSTTPPSVTVTSITNPVTASNEHGVTAAGSVSKSAATVQVLYTSSGTTPTKLLVNGTITQPSDPSVSTATWSAGPSDLSSLPDGPVTVKVTAKTQSGLQATATKTIKMQAHISTLSEFTNHTVVTANRAIHISGHLSDQSGNPVANATISVRPRFTNGKLGHAATVVTSGSGAYSATFVPKFSAKYIATYAGSPQHDGARASTARTNVRAAVSLSGKARQGSRVTVTGHVSPGKSGKTITIFKKTSSGWVVAGKVKLNSKSSFTAHLSLAPGKNRLYAAIGATSGNLAGKSGVLVITVG